MIGGKSYLLCQVWLIPVVNYGLEFFLRSHTWLPQDIKPFLPGLAVGLSHVLILALAFINIPSLSALMTKNAINGKRKAILNALKRNNSPEHEAKLRHELELLDLAELQKFDIEIEAANKMHLTEMNPADDK